MGQEVRRIALTGRIKAKYPVMRTCFIYQVTPNNWLNRYKFVVNVKKDKGKNTGTNGNRTHFHRL